MKTEEKKMADVMPEKADVWEVPRISGRLLLTMILVSAGIAFPFGFHISCMNIPEKILEGFLNTTAYHEDHHFLSEDQLKQEWSIVISALFFGGVLGALICPPLIEWAGRKTGFYLAAFLNICGCVLMAQSKSCHCVGRLIFGRIVAGVGGGLGMSSASVFLSEIAPIHLRGFSAGFLEILMVIGKLSGEVMSLPMLLGNRYQWAYLVLFTSANSFLLVITLALFPESPKYLYAANGGDDKEKTRYIGALQYYQGDDVDVAEASDDMRKELALVSKSMGILDVFRSPILRRVLLLAITMRVACDLTGINVMVTYSTEVFRDLGVSEQYAQASTVLLMLIHVIVTSVAVFFVERTGRRPLYVGGLWATWLCLIGFMLVCVVKESPSYAWPPLNVLGVVVFCAHVAFFSAGPGPVPWLMIPELVPQAARSTVTSFGIVSTWCCLILLTATFLPLQQQFGSLSFMILIVPLFFCALYMTAKLPETAGRHIDQVTEDIAYGRNGERKPMRADQK